MHHFKDLNVWQQSMALCKVIHDLARKFPQEEKFVLTSQIMRSAISIPSNIAEGCGRDSSKELAHFLHISLGSAFELETQLILASEFSYLTGEEYNRVKESISEIQKMIYGFQKRLNLTDSIHS